MEKRAKGSGGDEALLECRRRFVHGLLARHRPGHPFCGGAPLLVAHRGGAGLRPENTLAAFVNAAAGWDADMLETDVRLTADGKVVVLHDATVDRTTDGSGAIAEMRWEEARGLDAGCRFRDSEGGTPFAGRGIRLPLFSEVLEELPTMRIMVEPKAPEAARPLVEVIRSHGAEHRVLIGAEWERTRRDARGYSGPWGASRAQVLPFWLLHRFPFAGALAAPRADLLQLPERSGRWRVVTPQLVRAAHRANLAVHIWTVDDMDDMRRLLAWGVDGIQTDRPDLLSKVLSEVAGRPPPAGAPPP